MFLSGRKSKNAKVGMCYTTFLPLATCPSTCPLRDSGCYGQDGSLRLFIMPIITRAAAGMSPEEMVFFEAREIISCALSRREKLPIRLHTVGETVTVATTKALAEAERIYRENGGGPLWGYTHRWREIPRSAWGGISIRASIESVDDIPCVESRGYTPALVIPNEESLPKGFRICPAQLKPEVTCTSCKLCWREKAKIAFLAHGRQKRKLSEKLKGMKKK